MLKAFVLKRLVVNNHESIPAFSAYVEPSTHSFSNTTVVNDICSMSSLEPNNNYQYNFGFLSFGLVFELSPYKHGKTHKRDLTAPSLEKKLMDDFLERENLAARIDTVRESNNYRGSHINEAILRTEPRAAISQTAEVKKLAKI
ncbi:hypothetical protein FXO37_31214 [Capsicum annuum]|nr:hypothetical protein FXO37_31214 [Capsicum annuum]